MPQAIPEFTNCINKWSIKGVFVVLLLITDLAANWYLYSKHPPLPPVNRRCSPLYPEFGVILNKPTSLPDGSIRAEDGIKYPAGSFWEDNNTLRGCPCSVKPCIRKCCPIGEAFNNEYKCVKNTSNSFMDKLRKTMLYKVNESKGNFSVLDSPCDIQHGMHNLLNISLLEDGKVQTTSGDLDQTKYCTEVLQNLYQEGEIVTVTCFQDKYGEILEQVRQVKASFLRATATVFHIVTFVMYALLPSLRRGVGGQNFMWLAAAMALKGFFNIVVISRYGLQYKFLCTLICLAMQYSWLASQTWQMVLSYQIWTTFKEDSMCPQGPDSTEHARRFRLYQTVAWGMPLVISAITLVANVAPFLPDTIKPRPGIHKCWFSGQLTRFIYTVIPVDMTEIVNLVLCVMTLQRLRTCANTSAALRTHKIKNIQWTKIYMRVCFVMGSAYFFVTIMTLITWNFRNTWGIPAFIVSTVVDIERVRGIEIFFIFVLKKKVLLNLFNRLTFRNELSSSG